jgi:hypothetical protein
MSQETTELARELVRAEGTADESDVALIVKQLALFPLSILTRLQADETKVVACRNSVTNYLTQLRGVRPRGWPDGATWDVVPGLFYPQNNEVVLAVVGHGTIDGPHIPATGEGQGSANLMLHETAHGVDMGGGVPFMSSNGTFTAARDADLDKLTAYERQPTPAGEEETFAESAARFYMGQDTDFLHLHSYWLSIANQIGKAEDLMTEPGRLPSGDTPGQTIGTASMSSDGTILLQLRATRDGARGDALLVYPRDHPRYDHILDHLGGLQPDERKHVLPFPDKR